ncbi:hypothetical protein EIP91_005653, partial [Steccherinum ochraceum]
MAEGFYPLETHNDAIYLTRVDEAYSYETVDAPYKSPFESVHFGPVETIPSHVEAFDDDVDDALATIDPNFDADIHNLHLSPDPAEIFSFVRSDTPTRGALSTFTLSSRSESAYDSGYNDAASAYTYNSPSQYSASNYLASPSSQYMPNPALAAIDLAMEGLGIRPGDTTSAYNGAIPSPNFELSPAARHPFPTPFNTRPAHSEYDPSPIQVPVPPSSASDYYPERVPVRQTTVSPANVTAPLPAAVQPTPVPSPQTNTTPLQLESDSSAESERRFPCPSCSRSFTRRYNLKTHITDTPSQPTAARTSVRAMSQHLIQALKVAVPLFGTCTLRSDERIVGPQSKISVEAVYILGTPFAPLTDAYIGLGSFCAARCSVLSSQVRFAVYARLRVDRGLPRRSITIKILTAEAAHPGFPCGLFDLTEDSDASSDNGLGHDQISPDPPTRTETEEARATSSSSAAKKITPVMVLEVPSGYVCWHGFALDPDSISFQVEQSLGGRTRNSAVFDLIATAMDAHNPSVLIFTDRRYVILVRAVVRKPQPSITYTPPVRLHGVNALRCVIGAALNFSVPGHRFSPCPKIPTVSGAMPEPSNLAIAVNNNPKGFRDFDLFTMQRHVPDVRAFLQWNQDQDGAPRIVKNDLLQVHVDAFTQNEATLVFRVPLEDPPCGVLDEVLGSLRPRQSEIDDFLASTRGDLYFKVLEVSLPHGAEAFSQKYSGRLERITKKKVAGRPTRIIRDRCDTRVRLTLFDERFFPTPPPEYFYRDFAISARITSPSERFSGYLPSAIDLMRHEQAAYDRLQSLQGILLPYSYGFHKFQMPTGHNVYGFLTEDVHGVPLPAPEDLPDIDLQRRMIRHLNLVERTLLYKGVGKAWYFESVTVTELPTDADDPTSFRVVVSDFAFARLRLGQDLYFPPMQEPVAE